MADQDDVAAVGAANAAFYAAFEAGDPDAMAAVWDHSPRVACTHPGAPTVFGWAAVERSWRAILGVDVPQFIITEARTEVVGDVAWVAAVENMIVGESSGAVSAINWFLRDDAGAWVMVGHHGAPITRPPLG